MPVSIKWLSHAGFQIKTKGRTIYIDLEEYGKTSEKADLILATHSHTDHCDPVKIKEIRKEDTVIIAPEDCIPKIGGSVKTLRPGEETTVNNIKVRQWKLTIISALDLQEPLIIPKASESAT